MTEHRKGTMELFSLLFRFRKQYASMANCETLSHGEMSMMSVLNAYHGELKKEVLPICELSSRLHTTQPAVTQLVNRLEAKGLVKREADPADRRTVLVRTTSQGTRAFKKEYEAVLQVVDGVIERMGEEKADAFLQLLDEFMGHAGSVLDEEK